MTDNFSLPNKELRLRVRVSIGTLIFGILILAAKFVAYKITHSHAIYSDAMESIVNVLTAFTGILVVYFSAMPVDEDHPYGHGKVEHFSAAFEGGLISFAAVLVIYQAVKAFLKNEEMQEIDIGLAISLFTGVANLAYGYMLKYFGRRGNSPALVASGVHLTTDFWTTLGAVIGVGLVRLTGYTILDQVTAVILGLMMARTGFRLVRQSAFELMDTEDIKILERLAEIFEKHATTGIIQIHHTKVIRSGWFHHIDAHVVVPEFWSVEEAHQRLDEFEKAVINEYEFSGEVNFHLDPCRRNYCSVCDYPNCPVRRVPFEKRMPVVLEHLRSKTEPAEFRQ